MKKTYSKEDTTLPRLIKQIAIPASVGFLFNTLFNVVDTIYGGMISTQAQAALSITFAIFFIIIAFGNGLSTGITALIANAIGAGKKKEAGAIAVQGISFGILLSTFITGLGLLFSSKLLILLGAKDSYLSLSLDYLHIIFYGTVFFILVYSLNAILNALGDTRTFRNFLIAGFFLNLLLNPWFIFGWFGFPALGLSGVAYSTILIQAMGCVYMAYHVRKVYLIRTKTLKDFIPTLPIYKEIAKQSIPASLNMVTIGLGIFIITYFISGFGEVSVAAYGIATRIEQIFLLPTIGLSVAALSLIGRANGAQNIKRIQEVLRLCLRYGIYLMTIGTIIIFFFTEFLMNFFTKDLAVIEIGVFYLRVVAFLTWAYVIMFINNSALQGMKRQIFPLWIGILRQIILPIIIFSFLIKFLGLEGIWWGIVFINWIAAIITILYVKKVISNLNK